MPDKADDIQRLVERIERDEAKRRERMAMNINGRRILVRRSAALTQTKDTTDDA